MAKDPRLNRNGPMPMLAPLPCFKKGRILTIEEKLDTINQDLFNCDENIDDKLDKIEEKIVEKLDKIEEKIVEKLDKIEKTMNEKLDKIEEKILFLVRELI